MEGSSTKAYCIENLDVFRRAVALSAELYRQATPESSSAVAARMREVALSVSLNLASGLGFWEREYKVKYFVACKQALIQILPLLELMLVLGEITSTAEEALSLEVTELSRMVNGLLRQAQRKEAE